MSDSKSSVVEGVKSILLPELRKLHEGLNEMRIRQEAVEQQLVMMNENILSNGRRIDANGGRIDANGIRIDANGKRIDDQTKRIDDQTKRIDDQAKRMDHVCERMDRVHMELCGVRGEIEQMRRDDSVTGDILHRMEILEERVLLGR